MSVYYQTISIEELFFTQYYVFQHTLSSPISFHKVCTNKLFSDVKFSHLDFFPKETPSNSHLQIFYKHENAVSTISNNSCICYDVGMPSCVRTRATAAPQRALRWPAHTLRHDSRLARTGGGRVSERGRATGAVRARLRHRTE